MRKYPSDISVSETCIDVNLKMVKRRDPDIFPCFPAAGMVRGTIPKISLKLGISLSENRQFSIQIQKQD